MLFTARIVICSYSPGQFQLHIFFTLCIPPYLFVFLMFPTMQLSHRFLPAFCKSISDSFFPVLPAQPLPHVHRHFRHRLSVLQNQTTHTLRASVKRFRRKCHERNFPCLCQLTDCPLMRLQINRCNFADTLRCNLILCQYPVHLLRKFFRILVPAAADAENYPLRNQPEYIGLPSTVHRHHNTCDLLLFSSLCRIPKCFFCLKPVKFLRQRSNIHISGLCIKRKRLSGHKHSRCYFASVRSVI